MRKGRPTVALILTPEERQRLDSLAHRSRSAAALARPALDARGRQGPLARRHVAARGSHQSAVGRRAVGGARV
jgi:hypothetical protein